MTRSRNRRLRLIPSHLPLIRDKLVEYERVALKEEMAAHSQYERSMEAAWNLILMIGRRMISRPTLRRFLKRTVIVSRPNVRPMAISSRSPA